MVEMVTPQCPVVKRKFLLLGYLCLSWVVLRRVPTSLLDPEVAYKAVFEL